MRSARRARRARTTPTRAASTARPPPEARRPRAPPPVRKARDGAWGTLDGRAGGRQRGRKSADDRGTRIRPHRPCPTSTPTTSTTSSRLAETSDVEAAEDIVTGNGIKLLAKGARIDARTRERLLQYRLAKPLENMLRVVPGTQVASFEPVAERLLELHPLLRAICASAHGFRAGAPFKTLQLSASVQSLLSVYAGRSPSQLEHAVGVALLAAALGADIVRDPADAHALVVAGLVHDVGELYVDPAFLRRESRLTPQQ